MKKGFLVAFVFLSIAFGGIRISHAHSRSKTKELDIIIDKNMAQSIESSDSSSVTQKDSSQPIENFIKKKKAAKKIVPTDVPESSIYEESNTYIENSTYLSESSEIIYEVIPEKVVVESSVEQHMKESIPVHTGVSYLGYDYDLGNFDGIGFVPSWTNTVFQWNDFPKHYLIEKNSYPGQTIFGLTIGSEVIISGVTFNVYDIVYNIENDFEALNLVLFNEAAATMQVCVTDDEDAALNLYFLR